MRSLQGIYFQNAQAVAREASRPVSDAVKLDGVKGRSLYVIARDIRADWKKVHYAAERYLKAMESLDNVKEMYGYDSGDYIVRYFLSNASTWHGDVARAIKAELKALLQYATIHNTSA
jgi:hypothetical protein